MRGATPGVLLAVERRRLAGAVLASSQDSLPDIRNIQSNNLRVVDWVKTFRKARNLLPPLDQNVGIMGTPNPTRTLVRYRHTCMALVEDEDEYPASRSFFHFSR